MQLFSLSEVVTLFLAFCGGISVIGAAAVYIGKAVGWIRKPGHRQDEILKDHESRISILESKADNDFSEIKTLKKEVNMMLWAVVAIMRHEINGNDVEALEKEQEKINEYLHERGES